ncbi:hypothetical protein KCU61_g489, partial [Aureobasidium melanogenum]
MNHDICACLFVHAVTAPAQTFIRTGLKSVQAVFHILVDLFAAEESVHMSDTLGWRIAGSKCGRPYQRTRHDRHNGTTCGRTEGTASGFDSMISINI